MIARYPSSYAPHPLPARQVVGGNFDMVMESLSQLTEFVSTNLPPAVFAAALPSFLELVKHYHVPVSVALFVAQPAMYHVRMLQLAGSEVPEDLKKWDSTGVSENAGVHCVPCLLPHHRSHARPAVLLVLRRHHYPNVAALAKVVVEHLALCPFPTIPSHPIPSPAAAEGARHGGAARHPVEEHHS